MGVDAPVRTVQRLIKRFLLSITPMTMGILIESFLAMPLLHGIAGYRNLKPLAGREVTTDCCAGIVIRDAHLTMVRVHMKIQ